MVRSVLIALLFACASPLVAQKPALPEGPGKAVLMRVCSQCHGVEVAAGRRESREGWNAIVSDMVERGAQGTDDELGAIVEYLTANFSKSKNVAVKIETKVEINKVAAETMVSLLQVTPDEAAAIVHYREANGAFKSFEDLAKVPGLDASKLEAKKASIVF